MRRRSGRGMRKSAIERKKERIKEDKKEGDRKEMKM